MTTKKKKILSDAEVEGGLKVGGTLNIPIQNGLLATNNSGDVTADASIDLDELHTLDGIDKTQTIQTQLTDLGTRITNLDDAAVHKAGTETIPGAKTFTADTVMSGNVTVGAAGSPSKDLHVLGNADVDGYLNVDGAFATPHITDAGGNNDNVQIKGSVTVSKNAIIGTVNNGNSLTVNGNETLNGVLDVPTIKNSRAVSNVDQPLTLDDDVTITSGKTLKVSSITGTTSDELNINTPVNVTGDLSTTTDVIAGRDLAVTRNASVTGVLTAPTLHTQHISDPDDDVVEIDDTLNVNGNLNVVGASSDLSVGRNASITGTLYTDTIASKTPNDPVTMSDNLTVTGTTTSTGLITANGGLTVNGASTLNGNISQSDPSSGSRTASLQDTTVKSLNITGSTANSILRTDGSKNVSATAIDGTADKVLTTGSGNTLTWQLPTTTSSPTENSNAVASIGSVYLEKTRAETVEGTLDTAKVDKTTTVNGHALSSDVTVTKGDVGLGNVQNYGMDNSPTNGSSNYVSSGGVYTAISGVQSDLTTHTSNNSNPHSVTKSQVGLGSVQNYGMDSAPTNGSSNYISSGGVYTALAAKAPNDHASSATTYGVGSSSNYGHVKLDTSIGQSTNRTDTTISESGIKAFVNSSIGTATANFLGTYTALEYRLEPAYLTFTSTSDYVDYYVVYNSTYTLVIASNKDSLGITAGATKAYSQPVDSLGFTQAQVDEMTDPYSTESGTIATALGTVVSNPSPNDYVFVEMDFTDPTTSPDEYRRYKYDGSVWQYEYTLNNSSFTQAQWDAINSGINTTLVTKLNGIETGAEVNVQSDWSQADTTADDYIKNKPGAIVQLGDLNSYAGYVYVSGWGSFIAPVMDSMTYSNDKLVEGAYIALNSASDKQYTLNVPDSTPTANSVKLVTSGGIKTALDAKLNNSQLVTSTDDWSSTVSDSNIPSEKLVKDTLDTKVTNNSTYGGLAITGETTANNSANHAVAINGTVSQNADYAIAMGHGSFVSAYSQGSIAIGLFAQVPSTSTGYAIQLGRGSNTEHDTFKVGFQEGYNYKLLDGTTGKIPVDRLTVDATPTASSTNPVTSGGVKTALDAKVAGPSSSADSNVALFDGTTGKLIKDSGKTLGASIPAPTASQDEGKAIIVNSSGTGFEFGEAGKVDDIKVNNTSIVSSKEANIVTGAGLISSSNTIKAKLSSESSIGTIGNNQVYAVGVDSSGYLSVNLPWTDTKVFQEAVSTNVERPLMLGYRIGTNPISDSVNGPLFKTTSITANPSTGTITATGFVGNVTGNCSGSAGSVVYSNITSNPLTFTTTTIATWEA